MLAAPSRAHDGLQSPHTVAVQNCRIGSALASTCWITSDIRPPYRYLSSGRRAWGLARRGRMETSHVDHYLVSFLLSRSDSRVVRLREG